MKVCADLLEYYTDRTKLIEQRHGHLFWLTV